MLDFEETTQRMFTLGFSFTIEEYIFAINVVFGEQHTIAYALAFDPIGYKKVLGTEDEHEYLMSKAKDCDVLLKQQYIARMVAMIEESLTNELQSRALNLENYKFNGGQIAQILQNLLHNRISDLDSASTKDVISLIKVLTEQFGIDGGGEFEKHFIQVLPKFNGLCVNCNREIDVVKGLDCVCPHCGQVYAFNEDEDRFYPQPSKL